MLWLLCCCGMCKIIMLCGHCQQHNLQNFHQIWIMMKNRHWNTPLSQCKQYWTTWLVNACPWTASQPIIKFISDLFSGIYLSLRRDQASVESGSVINEFKIYLTHFQASRISLSHTNIEDSSSEIQAMDSLRAVTAASIFPESECFPYTLDYLDFETNKVRSWAPFIDVLLLKMYSYIVSYLRLCSTEEDQIHNGVNLYVAHPILPIPCL